MVPCPEKQSHVGDACYDGSPDVRRLPRQWESTGPVIAARHSKCWNKSCACIAADEVMTTKDYIYLGLILLTAMAFYCNGFYAGVYRCKRMYDTLLDDADVTAHADSQNV